MDAQNYVNGRWTTASGGDRVDVTNPAGGDVLASLAMASRLDVAAERWPDEWSRTFGIPI